MCVWGAVFSWSSACLGIPFILSFPIARPVAAQERTGVKMIMIQDGPLPTGADKPLRITGDAFKVQVCIEGGFASRADRVGGRIWNNGTVGGAGGGRCLVGGGRDSSLQAEQSPSPSPPQIAIYIWLLAFVTHAN